MDSYQYVANLIIAMYDAFVKAVAFIIMK